MCGVFFEDSSVLEESGGRNASRLKTGSVESSGGIVGVEAAYSVVG